MRAYLFVCSLFSCELVLIFLASDWYMIRELRSAWKRAVCQSRKGNRNSRDAVGTDRCLYSGKCVIAQLYQVALNPWVRIKHFLSSNLWPIEEPSYHGRACLSRKLLMRRDHLWDSRRTREGVHLLLSWLRKECRCTISNCMCLAIFAHWSSY